MLKSLWLRGVALAALTAMSSSPAGASGFQILEQGTAGLGAAFSGTAAIANDPSTVYWNPAGMTYLNGYQLGGYGTIILPQADFENRGSRRELPAPFSVLFGSLGGGIDDGGETALVGAFYGTAEVTEDIRLGLAINAPFGLSTDYHGDWVGRYQAVDSSIFSIDVAPSAAYRVNDWLSVGAGLNVQYTRARLTNAVDFGTIGFGARIPGALPGRSDGYAEVIGDDVSVSFNAGVLVEPFKGTRLGVHYQHEQNHELDGDIDYSDGGTVLPILQRLGGFQSQDVSAEITYPRTVTASLYHEITPELAGTIDVAWTDWSVLEQLDIVGENSTGPGNRITQDFNWHDTIRVAAGLSYKFSEILTIRTGFAYDEAPVPDSTRTPRLPDQDRYWLAVGGTYDLREILELPIKVDFGYAHIFVDDAAIDIYDGTGRNRLVGTSDNSVDLISLGGSLEF